MENSLRVALIQSNIIWENPLQNQINFAQKIEHIKEPIDLIVLPEMFTTGFTMNPQGVAEYINGSSVLWMKSIAKSRQAAITGSLIIKADNAVYYNQLLFVYPTGDVEVYNKRHTFTLAGEDKVYASGNKKVIIDYKGWKICPLICYDLRFPVWSRNTENYDVLVYVANWPESRIAAWDSLLQARAIENISYSIGVNRVGIDANNIIYPGHSSVYNVLGEKIDAIPRNKEATQIITLSKEHIENYRTKYNFLADADDFSLHR